jgi:ABC-type lipoprotein export system ATPase subunit
VAPSGAGKTTLLAAIAGFHSETTGEIAIDSGAHVEWLIQSSPLLNRRSGIDNAMTAAAIRFGPSRGLMDQARTMLLDLGLTDEAHRVAYKLSGGERQRVALARALLARPDLLLADEPTASLDPSARDAVIGAITKSCAAGCAAIVATHDPLVAASCDQAIVLDPLPVETSQ